MVPVAKWGVITPSVIENKLEQKISNYMAQGYKRDVAVMYAKREMERGF